MTAARWRVELPPGWQPRCGPGVALLAVAPVPVRRVAAHLLLAFETVAGEVTLETLADQSLAPIGAIGRDIQVWGDGVGRVGELERSSRVVSFEARRGAVELAQVVAFVAPPGRRDEPTRDVAQFVGTCAFDELPRYADVFAAVVESLAVSPHPYDPRQ